MSNFNDLSVVFICVKDCTSVFVVCSFQVNVLDEVMDKHVCHGTVCCSRDKPAEPVFKFKAPETRVL